MMTALLVALCSAGGCERPANRGPWRVAVLEPDDPPPAAELREGLLEGLTEGGVTDGAQQGWQTIRGPAATLTARAREQLTAGTDLALAVTTAGLAAAEQVAPAVAFTGVADPAGAGVHDPPFLARWIPWLFGPKGPPTTGAFALTDFAALLDVAAPILPDRDVGAVFAAGDADSVAYRDQLRAFARRNVVSAPLTGADAAAAVASLCDQEVGTVVLLGDRTTDAVAAAIVGAARACAMVVLGTSRAHVEAGAVLTLPRDGRGAARAAGRRAAELLRGGRPHLESFERRSAAPLVLNARAADLAGIGLPLTLIERADEVVGD
jgi:ABC-type uncharacterized transport system substrate-binding protein